MPAVFNIRRGELLNRNTLNRARGNASIPPVMTGETPERDYQYGIIKEAVGGHIFKLTEDGSENPEYDSEKPQGKVKIIGKEYPENTSVQYGEPCICHELAEDDNEVLLIGTQVKVIKVDEIDNESFVDSETTPEEPEKITRWAAVETAGEYYEKLDAGLEYNETSTITVKDEDDTEFEFTVHSVLIPSEKMVPEGTKVTVGRINKTLVAIQHPCPTKKPKENE